MEPVDGLTPNYREHSASLEGHSERGLSESRRLKSRICRSVRIGDAALGYSHTRGTFEMCSHSNHHESHGAKAPPVL